MRDKIHEAVKAALIKDEWEILADPRRVKLEEKYIEIDLEAGRLLLAEKEYIRIFVEVKSLSKGSLLYQIYAAYGQYQFYRDKLRERNMNQPVYLAVSSESFKAIAEAPDINKWLKQHRINLLVVDTKQELIERWINY